MKIPHIKLLLNQNEITAIQNVLESGFIAEGKQVREFEKLLCKYIGIKFGCAANSGTSSLHLALNCLNLQPNDEIILPSYLCTAPLNAINYTGAKPVLTDINKDDFTINIDVLEKKISKKTKAIIVPHMFGAPADMDLINSLIIQKKKFVDTDIAVIEDCAHSLGAKYKSNPVGSLGDFSVFSFYATKLVGVGFGGMVCTNRKKIFDKIRDLINFDERDNYIVRFNYKMSNLTAAIGIEQLKKLNYSIERRRQIAEKYNQLLKDTDLILPVEKKYAHHIYYRYIVLVPRKLNSIINYLQTKNIETKSPVYNPLHRYLKLENKYFKNTEYVQQKALSLPIYALLKDSEIAYICENIKSCLKKIL